MPRLLLRSLGFLGVTPTDSSWEAAASLQKPREFLLIYARVRIRPSAHLRWIPRLCLAPATVPPAQPDRGRKAGSAPLPARGQLLSPRGRPGPASSNANCLRLILSLLNTEPLISTSRPGPQSGRCQAGACKLSPAKVANASSCPPWLSHHVAQGPVTFPHSPPETSLHRASPSPSMQYPRLCQPCLDQRGGSQRPQPARSSAKKIKAAGTAKLAPSKVQEAACARGTGCDYLPPLCAPPQMDTPLQQG